MQNLLYRWLLLVGLAHVVLGVILAFAAHLPIAQPYFDYLHASVSNQPPPVQYQQLLRTLFSLFGPTIASWGLLFCALVALYRRHGHRPIKPLLLAALLLWCVLDSAISLHFGLALHAYLNAAAALSIALPLLLLRPFRACRQAPAAEA